jgi:hypothetical protein
MAEEAVSDGPKFDFITEAGFRSSLESDYRELTRCLENGACKAVHVLAGSVVEAILTDYLLGIDYQKKAGKDPLKMELAPIISACRSEGIITERTADLSSVIRSYRNLIHPGRAIRLNEKVDMKTALIAKALVDVVADEVAAAKALSYGLTAEQIANKIEKDPSALALLTHFLRETNDRERERLVLDVIPQRFFFARDLGDETSSGDYERCHRQTFDTLPDEGKARVARRFIKVLKEDPGDYVLAYENAFFRAADLKYLVPSEVAMAKARLLSRLEKEQTVALLEVVEDFGPFLNKNEASRVLDAYVRAVAYGKSQAIRERGKFLLLMLHWGTSSDVQKQVETRLDSWITTFSEKGLDGYKATLEEVKSGWAIGESV